jgi:type I restriction enzyme S subunit
MSNGWQKKKLRDIATVTYGESPRDILAEDGSFPVFGTGGIERFGRSYLYEGESVILGRKGTIDKPVYVNGKFWAIDTTYYLHDFKDSNVKWLYYYLQTINLRAMSEATGVPSISRDYLYAIEINTPPEVEQTRIAAILSCLDRAIEQTEAIIAKQQRIKTGLIQDLLTKGIDEQGEIRSDATHEFKDSPLGRIPKEWNIERFGEACEKVSVGIATSTTKHFCDEGVPLIRNQNVKENGFDIGDVLFITRKFDEANKNKRLKPLDIVIVRTGYPGLSCVVADEMAGWHTFTTLISRPRQDKYDSHFLSQLINSYVCKRQIANLQAGGAQQNLNVGWIVNLAVLRPPRQEQTEIVRVLDSLGANIRNDEAKLSKCKRLKAGLMQDLLTGTVSVENLSGEPTAVCA